MQGIGEAIGGCSTVTAQQRQRIVAVFIAAESHLDENLIARGYAEIVALSLPRSTPGGLKDILEPPEGADAQTRLLAYPGRRAW